MTVMTSVPDPSTWLVSRVALAGGIDFEQLARESERESNDLLEDAVAELPDSLPVTRLLKHGRPGERILEQVSDGGHDLVVMASSGRGEVRSLVPAASATWC
jgi:nucleotide-binding universal stress UspA family protein